MPERTVSGLALLGHTSEFQRCHELGLERDPASAGNVVIRARVEKSGAVSEASVVDGAGAFHGDEDAGMVTTAPDKVVIECILGVFRRMRFPRSGRPTGFSFPFVLKPKPSGTPR